MNANTNNDSPATRHPTQRTLQMSYTNGALTAIALLLGVVAFQNAGLSGVSTAHAQEPAPLALGGDDSDTSGRISAAEQRKQIIAELRTLQTKVERVEQIMNKGMNVKVVDMPEMKLPQELRKALQAQANGAAAPETGVRVSPNSGVTPASGAAANPNVGPR